MSKSRTGIRRARLQVERLENRNLLTTDFVGSDQLVDIENNGSISASPISMRILQDGTTLKTVTGNQVSIHHSASPGNIDKPLVMVLNTSGDLRLLHPDLDIPVSVRDKPGATITLPPLLWVEDAEQNSLDYLDVKVTSLDIDVTEAPLGRLILYAEGMPTRGSGAALPGAHVKWKIVVPRTTPLTGQTYQDVASLSIDVDATFNEQVELSDSFQARAEAFRAAVIRSSNVPDSNTQVEGRTHDTDQVQVYDQDGNVVRTIALNVDQSQLLDNSGGIATKGLVKANQTTPAPLNGDPPNVSIRITSADTPIHRAQGYIEIEEDTNQDDDNVGIWLNRMLASNTIPAGRNLRWTVHVTASDAINLPPELGKFSGTLAWTEGDAPKPIIPGAVFADRDSSNLATGKLTARISAGAGATDHIIIAPGGNVSTANNHVLFAGQSIGTFTGGVSTNPLVVTWNAAATSAKIQAVLRRVAYTNVSNTPATQTRTFTATVTDGDGGTSATQWKLIRVATTNDPPVLSLSGTLGYTRGDPAIVLASAATVRDADSANFGGGRLRVRIDVNGGPANTLAIGDAFSVDAAGNVRQGTTIIGRRLSNGIGTNELIIQFNTSATKAVVQALVRSVTYRNVGGAGGQRKIVFTVSDGDGGLSAEQTKTVNVK